MKYDVIVVGGGHNGLVCGTYLAKAGKKVCVVERRELVGGACVTEELWPGFKADTAAQVQGWLQPRIILELELQKFGYDVIEPPPMLHQIGDGAPTVLWGDPEQLSKEFSRHSPADAIAYPRYQQHLKRVAPAFRALLWQTPPRVDARSFSEWLELIKFGLRNRAMLGSFHDIYEILTMSAYDYLSRWFESDAMKTILGYYPAGAAGMSVSIHTPGTAYFLLRAFMRDNGTPAGGSGIVRGGMGAISEAILASGRRHGMTVLTGSAVAQIVTRNGRACGVVLENGQEFQAGIIAANAPAKIVFSKLVRQEELPDGFQRDIAGAHSQSTSFKINVAMSGLPEYRSIGETGFPGTFPTRLTLAPSVAYMDRAYYDMCRGEIAEKPFLSIQVSSLVDPGMAPAGSHIVSLYGGHVPGPSVLPHDDETRSLVTRRALETVETFAPGFTERVIDSRTFLASDYERILGLPGGSPHHTDMSLDQMFLRRPSRQYSNYHTPIRGLFLCGASSHPGGGVSGVPGHNAAKVILREARG